MNLNNILTPKIQSILLRAVKTFAQTAASMIAIGVGFEDVDWIRILSVSGVAFILSVLTNLGGTPESTYEGEIVFYNNGEDTPAMEIRSDIPITELCNKGSVNMRITDNYVASNTNTDVNTDNESNEDA